MVYIRNTEWKTDHWTHHWPMRSSYLHVDAPVCLYAYMRIWGGLLVLSVRVYTLSACGHLDWVCVVLCGESAHMCLHGDLVLCGCVFDKLWEHVGDCLSIHLGEREQNEEVEEICFQPLSSSQSAHSHTNLSFSSWAERGGRARGRQAGRERQDDRLTDRQTATQICLKRGKEIQSGRLKKIERIFV